MYCEADGCGAVVPDSMEFCPKHWNRIDVTTRRKLKALERGSDEREKLLQRIVDDLAMVWELKD